jgi:hypothetical protein
VVFVHQLPCAASVFGGPVHTGLLQQPLASLSFTTSTEANGDQCQQLPLAVLLASWSSVTALGHPLTDARRFSKKIAQPNYWAVISNFFDLKKTLP